MFRNTVFFIGILIFFSVICFLGPSFGAESKVNWQNYSDGIKMMKEQNKNGFLHFYTDWCTYCKLMNQQTFTDQNVAAFLNEKFIPIRVNGEKETKLANDYHIDRYPNTWFIKKHKEIIGNRPGFISPDLMLNVLKYIDSGCYKDMTFSNFMEKNK